MKATFKTNSREIEVAMFCLGGNCVVFCPPPLEARTVSVKVSGKFAGDFECGRNGLVLLPFAYLLDEQTEITISAS